MNDLEKIKQNIEQVEKEQKEGAKYYTLEKLNESLLQIIQNK